MANNYLQSYLQPNSPPVPPQAAVLAEVLAFDPIPISVRRQRVANGSRRKRDLAAVSMADELVRIERLAEAVEAGELFDADEVWAEAQERLRSSVPASTFEVWIKPLVAMGALDGVLYLSAPDGIRAWAERRYASLIAEALRDCSDLERVSFASLPTLEGPVAA